MKQEKLCESEDMTFEDEWDKNGNRVKFFPGSKEYEAAKDYGQYYPDPAAQQKLAEELGAENERVRQQVRKADQTNAGLLPKDRVKVANSTQIGGDHYKRMDIQPWDVVDYGPKEQAIGFYRYNALKYIMRAGEKGDAKEDFQKAHHYLQKLLEIL